MRRIPTPPLVGLFRARAATELSVFVEAGVQRWLGAKQKLDSRPDWTGMGQNGLVRVLAKSHFLVSPGSFFLKRVGGIVTSLSEQTGAHLAKHLRLALSEFSSQGTYA